MCLCVLLNADIGADVLDLAETMVASDGLKYEPVSMSSKIIFLNNEGDELSKTCAFNPV